jgi:hypothetical protein
MHVPPLDLRPHRHLFISIPKIRLGHFVLTGLPATPLGLEKLDVQLAKDIYCS